MAYHIKSQNVFGDDTYICSSEDLKWTGDFSQRKLFPTLFQAETVINSDGTIATGINGMTYKTAKWRKAIIVNED
tara:strand:+ start:66 stop:290 length:225 start_codon:yes stop_codon:yes gene_type:complete